MKSMLTLMKMRQSDLDLVKRQVVQLETKREEIYATINVLADRLASEIKAATDMPDMAHFFGDYSTHIKKRQDQLHTLARRTEVEIDKLRLAINALYSEIKTYEQAYKNWKAREAKKLSAREQAEMDDIALQGYVRKQAPHA